MRNKLISIKILSLNVLLCIIFLLTQIFCSLYNLCVQSNEHTTRLRLDHVVCHFRSTANSEYQTRRQYPDSRKKSFTQQNSPDSKFPLQIPDTNSPKTRPNGVVFFFRISSLLSKLQNQSGTKILRNSSPIRNNFLQCKPSLNPFLVTFSWSWLASNFLFFFLYIYYIYSSCCHCYQGV